LWDQGAVGAHLGAVVSARSRGKLCQLFLHSGCGVMTMNRSAEDSRTTAYLREAGYTTFSHAPTGDPFPRAISPLASFNGTSHPFLVRRRSYLVLYKRTRCCEPYGTRVLPLVERETECGRRTGGDGHAPSYQRTDCSTYRAMHASTALPIWDRNQGRERAPLVGRCSRTPRVHPGARRRHRRGQGDGERPRVDGVSNSSWCVVTDFMFHPRSFG
jgi:hypothetical protein